MKRILLGAAGFLALAALWEIAPVDRELFPSSIEIAGRLFQLGMSADFWLHSVGASMWRLALASLIVLPLAIVLGVTLALSDTLRALFGPFFNFTLPLPKVALFPLMLAIFGIGDSGKIFLIAVGAFYPLFFNVLNGTLRIRGSELMEIAAIYKVRGRKLWVDIYGRGLLLDILTGLKTSIGYGFTLTVVSELTASNNGLGHFIWRAWDSYEIVDMYAGVLGLCVLGWMAQSALDYFLRRLLSR